MYPPVKNKPKTLTDYLVAMSRAIFTSGISWKVVDAKWDGILEAFDGFDVRTVSAYTPHDIERLMTDKRVVRNRKKIEAIIENAGELIVVDREFGGFDRYLDSFESNDELVKDLHERFRFLGESVAHFFLYGIGFDVPAQDEWAHAHFGSERHHHSGDRRP